MMKKLCFPQLLLILLMVLASSVCTFATDGDGEGGGQNQEEPLTLVTSSIQNGQDDIPIDVEIHLEFSKNVVNMAVAENNRNNIALTNSVGNSVPIEIRMGDDQVDPTIKRLITIIPKEALTLDSRYTLTINSGFRSKSGTSLDSQINIAFQTAGSIMGNNDNTGDNKSNSIGSIEEGSTADAAIPQESTAQTGVDSDGGVQATSSTKAGENPWMVFSIICFIAAAILLLIYALRRKKK